MVLDYNKVSTMRRASACSSNESANRDSKMPTTTNLRQEPLFVTDQSVDVALLTEEVVDGEHEDRELSAQRLMVLQAWR
jgi:hypothetical protein